MRTRAFSPGVMILGLGLLGLAFAFLVVQITTGGALLGLDFEVEAALAPVKARGLERVFEALSGLGDPKIAILLSLLVSLVLIAFRRFWGVLALWVGTLGVWAGLTFIKDWIARPRPEIADATAEASFSFPSGHATIAVALYGLLAYLMLREPAARGRILLPLAVVVIALSVGVSRLALSQHYFSDILGGYLLGALWVLIGAAVAGRERS